MRTINPTVRLVLCAIGSITVAFLYNQFIFSSAITVINNLATISLGLMVFIILYVLVSGPFNPLSARRNLERAGLVNHTGEVPILIHVRKDFSISNGIILEFTNQGIARERWEDRKAELEAAFNIYISKIKEGKNRRRTIVYAVPGNQGLPDRINWDASYLSTKDFELVLGRGLTGLVTTNLASVPHILCGGSTGSGKSVLMKNLCAQCIEKGASVDIADFKGAVDYAGVWEDICRIITDEEALLSRLKELVGELETRKEVFKKAECANIYEYNTRVRNIYRRVIIACDEVAELLDKTGRTKEDKERIDKVISYLSTIARQGRAMGIHLILATQRPDATILPGQIKNNIDCRICGRADQVLSQVVLDAGDANDLVPKDAQGRFVMGDGTLFQGFWFDDNDLCGSR